MQKVTKRQTRSMVRRRRSRRCCVYEREEEGRPETTCGARRSWSGRWRRTELVKDVSLGRPRSNRGYWEMRRGVVSALVCSGRQEVAVVCRISQEELAGTAAV